MLWRRLRRPPNVPWLPAFAWSNLFPVWVEPRLAFHTVFGIELVLFDIGNLILIYRLARKLAAERPAPAEVHPANRAATRFATARRWPTRCGPPRR